MRFSIRSLVAVALVMGILVVTSNALPRPSPPIFSKSCWASVCDDLDRSDRNKQQRNNQDSHTETSTTRSTVSTTTAATTHTPNVAVPTWLHVRGGGGGVETPTTLDDVESILIRAGSEGKLVVIDFSASWCGPCKMIAPLFEELAENTENVIFLKIDVDENPDTAAKYNVSAMPTFVFIKSGEVVDRLMGANPERLQELIDEHK